MEVLEAFFITAGTLLIFLRQSCILLLSIRCRFVKAKDLNRKRFQYTMFLNLYDVEEQNELISLSVT